MKEKRSYKKLTFEEKEKFYTEVNCDVVKKDKSEGKAGININKAEWSIRYSPTTTKEKTKITTYQRKNADSTLPKTVKIKEEKSAESGIGFGYSTNGLFAEFGTKSKHASETQETYEQGGCCPCSII